MVPRLVTLAVQNAMLSVIMHYSRVDSSQSEPYSAATAVLMVELLKGGISFAIAFSRVESPKNYAIGLGTQQPSLLSPRTLASRFRRLCKEIFRSDCWKLSIPAILYGESARHVHDLVVLTFLQSFRIICNMLQLQISRQQPSK
jgi:solute carrier family 35 (UDP-sugar transporter), member A1/2/3